MPMNLQSQHPALEQLPESFAIVADNISAIRVSGDDANSYLQGQLTCDLSQLVEKQLLIGGHCDAKGKMFSAFRLITHNQDRLMIQSKGCLPSSLTQLQKYGVFAKVDINEADDLAFLALVGQQGVAFLEQQFGKVPDSFNPVVAEQGTSIIYIPGSLDRYLMVSDKAQLNDIAKQCQLPIYDHTLWTAIEIQSGFVHLNELAAGDYVPQMVNLQLVNGISFSKGCYMGQETVARMKYLGKNKRALFALQGHIDQVVTIADDAMLELQMGENWRRGGNVISHYQADSGELYIQAVLASDTEPDAVFRLKEHTDVTFKLMSLPYSLAE